MIKQITKGTYIRDVRQKCIDGDSDHQTSTGIQRHRLRALFERDDYGNTAGADGLNTGRMVLKNRNVEVGS